MNRVPARRLRAFAVPLSEPTNALFSTSRERSREMILMTKSLRETNRRPEAHSTKTPSRARGAGLEWKSLECPHGRDKYQCAVCTPCPHGKVKGSCAECTPCPHGKVKRKCTVCNGCSHGKSKYSCLECNPCSHGKRKDICAECNPCPHGKGKRSCVDCTCCPHELMKYNDGVQLLTPREGETQLHILQPLPPRQSEKLLLGVQGFWPHGKRKGRCTECVEKRPKSVKRRKL